MSEQAKRLRQALHEIIETLKAPLGPNTNWKDEDIWRIATQALAGQGEEVTAPTPLQAAALAALVAWRKADIAWWNAKVPTRDLDTAAHLAMAELVTTADRLIAEQEATS